MRDVEMTVTADDGLPLAGTLTLPAGPGPHPAVLLLHGSGRLDRDANTGRLRMELGPPLAAALAKDGIATLRYDRRGVGATSGDWRATGFTDNRHDAAAALRALAGRPDIRADAIGLVGHSEGAVHAMSLGTHPGVGAVVLLAGFARPGEDALRWQAGMIARGLPAPMRPLLPVLRALAARHLAQIRTSSADIARFAGMPVNARWMREMLDHDPRPDLANIRVPVLAITGGKDIQVDPADLDEIRRLVPGEVEVQRIPDLTHLLRRDLGRPSVRSYPRLLRRPVDADLLARVTGWLARRLRETSGKSDEDRENPSASGREAPGQTENSLAKSPEPCHFRPFHGIPALLAGTAGQVPAGRRVRSAHVFSSLPGSSPAVSFRVVPRCFTPFRAFRAGRRERSIAVSTSPRGRNQKFLPATPVKGKSMTTAPPARRQNGLALFWIVTFVTSWAFWFTAIMLGGSAMSFPTVVPHLLAGFGPMIGAIVIRARRARRRQPVPAHTVRLRLSTRLFWVPPLLVTASATVVGAALLAYLLGGPAVSLTAGQNLVATIGGPVPFLISMLIAGPLSEEPGWRGTAYPRLRASLSRLQTGLLLGVVWAVWHLPLFFVPGTVQAGFGLFSWSGLLFTISVIPMALLTGYAYERAGVAASIAVHFGVNATMALLSVNSPLTMASVVAVQIVVAIALLASRRGRDDNPPVDADPQPHRAGTDAPYQTGRPRG